MAVASYCRNLTIFLFDVIKFYQSEEYTESPSLLGHKPLLFVINKIVGKNSGKLKATFLNFLWD